MIRRISLVALSIGLFGVMNAAAQCPNAGKQDAKSSGCCKSGQAAAAAADGQCSKSADAAACSRDASYGMPVMKYKVGDRDACCPKEAETLAGGDKARIQFVIADKPFASEADAMKAYEEALNAYLTEVTAVKYAVGDKTMCCGAMADELAKKDGVPVRYRLATFTFNSQEDANKAAAAAKNAAQNVAMKMVVDGKDFQCPVSAREFATGANKPVEYAVGDAKTPCETTAKVELAKAKVRAAIDAISKLAKA